jgi:hypothetical protein
LIHTLIGPWLPIAATLADRGPVARLLALHVLPSPGLPHVVPVTRLPTVPIPRPLHVVPALPLPHVIAARLTALAHSRALPIGIPHVDPGRQVHRGNRSSVDTAGHYETFTPLECDQRRSCARAEDSIRLAVKEAARNQDLLDLDNLGFAETHGYGAADASFHGAGRYHRDDPTAVIDNNDVVIHDEVHVAAPGRMDRDQRRRHSHEMDVRGHRDADPQREIHPVDARHVAAGEHRLANSGALLRVERYAPARIAPYRSAGPILPILSRAGPILPLLSRAGLAFGLPTLLPLLRPNAAPVVLTHAVGLAALLTLLRAIALRVVTLRTLAQGPILLTLRAFSAHLALPALLHLALLRRSIAGSRSLAGRGTSGVATGALPGLLGAALRPRCAGSAGRCALRARSVFLRTGRHSRLARAALGRLRRGQGDARQERSGTQ